MKDHQQGYSLLEIILVLAVLAMLTLAGMSFLRQTTTNSKIEVTISQFQTIAQIAREYVSKNSMWPAANQFAGFLNQQDPRQSPLNHCPWRSPSTTTDPSDFCYQVHAEAHSNSLSIILTIPTSYSDRDAIAIANRIASHLPSAVANGRTITATIPWPDEAGVNNVSGQGKLSAMATLSGNIVAIMPFSRQQTLTIPKGLCNGTEKIFFTGSYALTSGEATKQPAANDYQILPVVTKIVMGICTANDCTAAYQCIPGSNPQTLNINNPMVLDANKSNTLMPVICAVGIRQQAGDGTLSIIGPSFDPGIAIVTCSL